MILTGGIYDTAAFHQGAIEILSHMLMFLTLLTTWRLPHSCQDFGELLKGTSAVHHAPPPRLWVSIAPLADVPFAFMCLLLRDACLLLAQLHLA